MRRAMACGWIAGMAAAAMVCAVASVREAAENSRVETAAARARVMRAGGFELPLAFEPSAAKGTVWVDEAQWVARGAGISVELGREGMLVDEGGGTRLKLRFVYRGKAAGNLTWRAKDKLAGETNYLIGRDASRWRTHVPRYGRAEAEIAEGVSAAAYGNGGKLEYDLQMAPGIEAGDLEVRMEGATRIGLDESGDLRMRAAGREMRMKRPEFFEERRGFSEGGIEKAALRKIEGGYVVKDGGRVGFWLGTHVKDAEILIDPTLTLEYATFLGGAGGTTVTAEAVDAQGNLYVSGQTAAGDFPGLAAGSEGTAGANTYLFVAKMNPQAAGAASVEWLTFIGGSGSQAGAAIAVSPAGSSAGTNVAIAGSTTSTDYPVTDGSTLGTGGNSEVVTELDQATGAKLAFSTMLGGSGTEENENARGVAIDGNGNLYVASDTTSADLCTGEAAATPFQATYGGGATDGFLAMYSPGMTPALRYCTYLGIYAQAGVTGLALDSKYNAYLVGFTTQPTAFPSTTNGFQPMYSAGNYDGFVVKVSPSGNGAADLSYATYLGATTIAQGTDQTQALGIAVDSTSLPATAFVVGTTSSPSLPSSQTAGYQPKLNSLTGGSNAFLAVIVQCGNTAGCTGKPALQYGQTALQYVTYLGGSGADAGLAVAETSPSAVYVAGSANSSNFPWVGNLQPMNGDADAFVAELDTTKAGAAGLLFSTPLGGTPAAGLMATSAANGVAVVSAGATANLYVAGVTNAQDFPQGAAATVAGAELSCASCPGAADGFVAAISENATGAAGPSVSFLPAVVKFGNSGVQNLPDVNVQVKNSGDAALEISDVSLSQAGGDFALSSTASCTGAALEPGGSCSFAVSFAPSTSATEGATIEITDNAPGGTQELEIEAVSTNAQAALNPSSINFGNVATGTTAGPSYVYLENVGSGTLAVTFPPSPVNGVYSFSAYGALPKSDCSEIPAHESCLISVSFTPKVSGVANGTMVITDNSGGQPGAQQTLMLTGNGTAGTPGANVAPGSLGFGSVTVGATSAVESVTLTNSGSSTLDVSSIGASGGGFAISGGATTNCPLNGGTLAPQANCSVGVTFTPGTGGAASGSLNFFDNAGAGEQSVTLSGTGATAAGMGVTPASMSFAPESVGTTSAPQTVTLANQGTTAIAITSIGVTGANAGDFVATPACGQSLPAGKSCVVQVAFAPSATGNRAATLTVTDNAAGSPQTVPLGGTATQAGIQLSAGSVTFAAAQLIGTPSPAQVVTVTSTGSGALAISKISFTGTDAADFSVSNTGMGSCTAAAGVTVPTGQSCTVSVVFSPTAQDAQCGGTPGARCATMTIADNAPASPQTLAVTGTEMDFEIQPPAGGSLAQTVTAGATATYTLEVASNGGFAGSVALSCSEPTAITGTACSVIPSSVNVTAGAAGTFAVNVTTTAAATSSLDTGRGTGGFEDARPGLVLGIFALAFYWMCGTRKRWRTAGVAAAAALGIAMIASCGGGGTAATDPPATLPGTYTNAITVTATTGSGSTTATRTAELTLVVQ